MKHTLRVRWRAARTRNKSRSNAADIVTGPAPGLSLPARSLLFRAHTPVVWEISKGEKMKRICTICGQEYTPTHPLQTKTCGSTRCKEEYRRVRARENARKKKSNPTPTVNHCVVCGRAFSTYQKTRKTCSAECSKMRRKLRSSMKYRNITVSANIVTKQYEPFDLFGLIDFTPGCTGPADTNYCPMEQHVGPLQWWGQTGVTA